MFEWWNELSMVSRIFACIAVPATAVMLLQTVLLLIGIGGGAGDIDVDGDLDVDFDGDIGGDFDAGPEDPGGDMNVGEQGDGLILFSIRGIVAFFSIGGWVGLVADRWGVPIIGSGVMAILAGSAALVGLAWLMKNVRRLQDSGNVDLKPSIGKVGEAYIPIPPKGEGRGKITLTVAGRLLELEAVSAGSYRIATGTPVMVCALSDESTVVVEPFGEPGNMSHRLP